MSLLRRFAARIASRSGLALRGPFQSWADARAASNGYESPEILRAVLASTRKVISGERPYERDGVCFGEVQHHWALFASLQRIALAEGHVEVLDFGGALGSTYDYVRRLWTGPLRWSIVEQPHFADAGRAAWAGRDSPQFFDSFEICSRAVSPNACLLSGVLQYLADPWALAEQIRASGIRWVIVDRTPVSAGPTQIFVQVVPPSIYRASYPLRLLNESELLSAFRSFEAVYEFASPYDPEVPPFKGFLLQRK